MTHWSEENEGDADWVHVNLNSLRSASVEKLSEEGLLTSSHDAIQPGVSEEKEKALGLSSTSGDREIHGAPWFQEMIEGSELGRIKHKRGVQTSTDGRKRVEWEVVDFSSELKENENNTSKRKLDQVGKEGDSEMRG